MTSIEIRVLSPAGIEDYHAHLLRLDLQDRRSCFHGAGDDREIDSHCLRLLGAQAIVIGGYVEGVLRAGLEICPDRTARRGDAIFTAEPKFALQSVTQMLLARMVDEARRYHLAELSVYGFDRMTELERMAQSGMIRVAAGTPLTLQFEAAAPASPAPGNPVASEPRYAAAVSG